jgi:hypothetical protein
MMFFDCCAYASVVMECSWESGKHSEFVEKWSFDFVLVYFCEMLATRINCLSLRLLVATQVYFLIAMEQAFF